MKCFFFLSACSGGPLVSAGLLVCERPLVSAGLQVSVGPLGNYLILMDNPALLKGIGSLINPSKLLLQQLIRHQMVIILCILRYIDVDMEW